ncbi:hypothetical protein DIPPA_21190 [Diplonema papillatum]|nr:hypothetical protein DIPPA_21190 [Diplonema papillatum]
MTAPYGDEGEMQKECETACSQPGNEQGSGDIVLRVPEVQKPSFAISPRSEAHQGDVQAERAKVTRNAGMKVCLFLFIGIPLLVSFFSVIFGAILAATEDRPFEDGFWLAATILTTSTTPLGGTTMPPQTDGGKVFATICGTWAMGIFATIVVLMSSPAADPLYAALRLR